MSTISQKLEHFANDIMTDVGDERRQLIEQVDEELRIRFKEKEQACLDQAVEIMETAMVQIDQKKNESLSRIIMGNRIKLFEKRNEIMSRVQKKAVDRLRAYKDMTAYKDWLIKKTEEAKALLGDGDYVVYLDHTDEGLKAFVEKETGLEVRLESKKVDMIGGCKVMNLSNHTVADYGFARKLEDINDEFIQMCHLEIN